VLNDERSAFGGHNPPFHDLGSDNALFRIEVRGWLINQVDVTGLGQAQHDSNALKFSTREGLDGVVEEGGDIEGHEHLSFEEGGVPGVLKFEIEEVLYGSFELGSDGLRLVGDVESWHFGAFVIRLHNSGKHFDESRFSGTVLPEHNNGF